jgi:hypothetical protein
MLAASLTSLLLLLSHVAGSSAKHVDFGSKYQDHLLPHRAVRRSVAASPSSDAAAAAPSSMEGADVTTNDDWNGAIDLSGPPPANLTESVTDLQADEQWCKDKDVSGSQPSTFVPDVGSVSTGALFYYSSLSSAPQCWCATSASKFVPCSYLWSLTSLLRREAAKDRAIVDRYFTEGWSASPEEYNALPEDVRTRWLKNAPSEIKADYARFRTLGFVAQSPRARIAAMQKWIDAPRGPASAYV